MYTERSSPQRDLRDRMRSSFRGGEQTNHGGVHHRRPIPILPACPLYPAIPVTDVHDPVTDVHDPFTDVHETFTDVHEAFTDVHDPFTDANEAFTDANEAFTDANEAFIEANESFIDANETFKINPERPHRTSVCFM